MGTFDSVYLNKIRHLEEENQQLKNIIDEAFAGISRRTLKDQSTPYDGRGALPGGRGIGVGAREEWLRSIDHSKIDKIDLSKISSKPKDQSTPYDGRDVVRRSEYERRRKEGNSDSPYMPSPSKRTDGLRINDARPEPAPYASDDMESRRAAEAERVRGERLRNELRGGGPLYRRAPPKSDLSFW